MGCSAAIAAMAGSRVTGYSFAPDGDGDIFIYVFLRGGCDGLNLVGPANDSAYAAERPPELRVTDAGDNAGLSLKNGLAGLDFRIHPKAAELKKNSTTTIRSRSFTAPASPTKRAATSMRRTSSSGDRSTIRTWRKDGLPDS